MRYGDLRETVEPVVAACGLELDDVAVVRAGNRRVVRVTVDGDGPDGHGPSLDEIAAVSAAVSRALDEADSADERPYVLEVSSRGVGRPLTRPAHWRRNRGRLVQITRQDGSELQGRIAEAADAEVCLDVAGAPVWLPYAAVAKAVVQVEFARLDESDAPSSPAT